MWDESKHPREADGTFRDKDYQSMSIDELKSLSRIDLNFFGSKTKNKSTTTSTAKTMEEVVKGIPSEAFGFLNKQRLNTEHHTEHAEDMGLNPKEYQLAAIQFWNNRQKVYYSTLRDRYCIYDERKKLFLAISSNGIIHTFMIKSEKSFRKDMIQERMYVCQEMSHM